MTHDHTIVLSSGEMSGDMHAAAVVSGIRERLPGARILALGGDRCRDAGAELLFHYREFAILGFTGVLRNLPRLLRLERALKRRIRDASLFVAVDYPGLNLRLAEYAHRRGVPVLYYIGPQLWAWGAGRMPRIARAVDRMAVILPFEEALYAEHDVDVEFVGHPFVVDHALPEPLPDAERKGIGLLPGSREQEVRRILPILLEAAGWIHARDPDVEFTVGMSPVVDRGVYESMVGGARVALAEDAVAVMRESRALMVASGTATLQGALLETPLVVVYRVSALNYFLARRLVRIENIGLVNVVLGDRVAPEFIQGDATGEAVGTATLERYRDGATRDEMRRRFAGLRDALAGGRGADRVAEIAAELIAR